MGVLKRFRTANQTRNACAIFSLKMFQYTRQKYDPWGKRFNTPTIILLIFSTSSGVARKIESNLETFLRFFFFFIDLKYSLKYMAIKSSTSSSLKMFNNYQSLEYTMFIIGTKFSSD